MSVEFLTGDLLEWPAQISVLAHGVSLYGRDGDGAYGAGLARQIAAKYPLAKESYFATVTGVPKPQLGDLDVVPVDGGARRIVNCFTQEHIGTDRRQLNYESLYLCLSQLKDHLETAYRENRVWTLGLPRWIGAGLAGGSGRIVEAMVRDLFEPSPIRCVVVEKA